MVVRSTKKSKSSDSLANWQTSAICAASDTSSVHSPRNSVAKETISLNCWLIFLADCFAVIAISNAFPLPNPLPPGEGAIPVAPPLGQALDSGGASTTSPHFKVYLGQGGTTPSPTRGCLSPFLLPQGEGGRRPDEGEWTSFQVTTVSLARAGWASLMCGSCESLFCRVINPSSNASGRGGQPLT